MRKNKLSARILTLRDLSCRMPSGWSVALYLFHRRMRVLHHVWIVLESVLQHEVLPTEFDVLILQLQLDVSGFSQFVVECLDGLDVPANFFLKNLHLQNDCQQIETEIEMFTSFFSRLWRCKTSAWNTDIWKTKDRFLPFVGTGAELDQCCTCFPVKPNGPAA